jgi:hypothetical protein
LDNYDFIEISFDGACGAWADPDHVAKLDLYCKSANLSRHALFWGDRVPPILVAYREGSVAQQWIAEDAPDRQPDALFYKGQPAAEARDNALTIMSAYYYAAKDCGTFKLYHIRDADLKVVEPVQDPEDYISIGNTIAEVLENGGNIVDSALAKRITDLYLIHSGRQPMPALIGKPGDGAWCLHRQSVLPDPSVPFPHIQGFLDRISDPEAFAALLYGIYSDRLKTRQIGWLQGVGEDGKSTFFSQYERLFGPAAGTADWTQMSNAPQFIAESFVNKRFVWIPDNSNQYLLMTDIMKSLASSGNDPITVNPKGRKMYQTRLQASTFVLSNEAPALSGARHNTSRTLWFKMTERTGSDDPHVGEKMWAEMPGFLAFGERCYEHKVENDYRVILNEASTEMYELRGYETNEKFEILFEQYFAYDPEGRLAPAEMYNALKDERLNDHAYANFKRFVETKYKVAIKQDTQGVRTWRGLRLRTPADNRKPLAAPKSPAITGTTLEERMAQRKLIQTGSAE